MESLISIDQLLFKLINQNMASDFLDSIMSFFHNPENPLTIFLLFSIFIFSFNKKIKSKFLNKNLHQKKISSLSILFTILLSIILADQLGGLIKDLGIRQRPWVNQTDLDVNCVVCKVNEKNQFIGGGQNKSFPSNHAANAFALAFSISFFFPKFKKLLYTIAIIIMYSRVHVGVHYPLDVITGMFIGLSLGYLIISLFLYIINRKTN